jgi:hypothetical protein
MSKQVIAILGMHRSGTSSLAGTLQEAGLFLGDVFTSNPWNPKGNRENSKIMQLHNALLEANGGSWDQPPTRVIWSEDHRRQRDAIIADYEGAACWGFKDPRTLLTVEGWCEALPNLGFVGTFRHPEVVARSLQRREGRDAETWIALWVQYNERLLAWHRRYKFPILDFDSDADTYLQDLRRVIADLNLPGPAEELHFFDPSLRQVQLTASCRAPAEAQKTYDALRALSRQASGSRAR